ncbi:MAG TPA: hypothetical protein PK733_19265 [Clostridiales bacterium]|nr:hypothetical protein [Clostridiales bacterium]
MNDNEEKLEWEENELEKNIADLKEWQDNQYNPGYYVGTGRIPRPLKSLSRYPVILIIFGIIGLLTSAFIILNSKTSIASIPGFILGLFFSSCLVYGGIMRIKERNDKTKQ